VRQFQEELHSVAEERYLQNGRFRQFHVKVDETIGHIKK
jgi:hypothetical protein